MFSSRLDSILKRSIFFYLVIPFLGLVFLVTLYLGWKQKQQIETQEQIRAQNVAQAVQIYVNNLSSELQKFAVFLTSKRKQPAGELLEYLYFHSDFDRLLLLEEHAVIHSLPGFNREFIALSSIFSPSQLKMDFQVQTSAPYYSNTSGEMSLCLLTATRTGSKVVGEVRLRRFQKMINQFLSSQERQIFITDRYGNLLAHPDSSLVEQQVNMGHLPPLQRAGEGKTPLSEICSYQDGLHLISVASIPLSSWRVVTSTPLFTLIGPLLKYLALLLAFILAGAALFIRIILRKLHRNVIEPLNRLAANTSQIKHGEPLSPISSSRKGSTFQELEDLKDEFNSMAKVLSLRESSLRQKNMEQRMLLDHVPLQIWFVTDPRTQGAVNKARAEFLGRPVQEVSHKPYMEIMDRETALQGVELNRQVFVTKSAVFTEDWFLDAQGSSRFLAVTRTPKLDPEGDVEFVVCTAQDITERWYFQEQLRRLSTAVEQSAASILITDRQGRVEYANPRFCSLTGFSFQELQGEPARILQSESLSSQERSQLWQTITSGGTWKGEFQERKKNEDHYWISLSVSPVSNQQGEINHFVVILDDITAKKQAEQELLRAKLEAEQASEAKSEFLANVSHEIRTPMNGILGMTNLLLNSELSSEQREFARIIQSSAESMMNVINQILDFSKLESTVLEIEEIDFDLKDSLETWLDAFIFRAQEKGLELYFWLDPGIPERVTGDPVRIQQILGNLMENALKFTAQGSISIRGGLQDASREGIKLLFEVQDTGTGIPQDKLALIFEPFTQADGSTTRRYGGTGLGLAICKQLAEMMGGQIGVQTDSQQGTTFWFTLQLKKSGQQSASREESFQALREKIKEVGLFQPRASKHVRLTQALLEVREIPVQAIETQEELLSALAQSRSGVHLLLLDEDHLGPELAEQLQSALRQKSPESEVKLALLSKRSLHPEALAQQRQISDYTLYKPVQEGELLLLLMQALNIQDQGASTWQAKEPSRDRLEPLSQEASILLAEDDLTNQKVLLHILSRLGYEPEIASNGLEVLDWLDKRHFDLLLMDLEMPEMDGLETAQRIRDREGQNGHLELGGNGTVIIGLSAHVGETYRHKCYQAGMDDFLSKPVSFENLSTALRHWLGRGNGNGEPEDGASRNQKDKVFDYHHILEQLGGDSELLEQLVDIFIQDAPGRLERIRQSLETEDWDGLEQTVHTLKGSAASVGANRLLHSVHKLNQACKNKEQHRASSLLSQVETDLRTLRQRLNK